MGRIDGDDMEIIEVERLYAVWVCRFLFMESVLASEKGSEVRVQRK